MRQKLEDFLKKHRLPLEFLETIKVTHTFTGRKNIRREEVQWTCQLLSVYVGQTVSIEHDSGCVNCYFTNGKTRKEAREYLVEFIRGKTLVYGFNSKYRVNVPKNIR